MCVIPGTTIACMVPQPVTRPIWVVEETVAAASSSSALPMLLGFVAIVLIHKRFMKGEVEEWPIEEEE